MLKIGDKVKFLNAKGGGTVTGFVSKKVVNVEDEEGFEVPCLIAELVKDERFVNETSSPIPTRNVSGKPVIEPAEVRKPKKESQPLFASSAGKPAVPNGAYFLAFVPEVPTMPLSGEIKAWLVNDSDKTLLYHFSLLTNGSYASEKSGRLGPYSCVPLKGITHSDFSTFPSFGVQILPFESNGRELQNALVKTLKVNPVKFYKETSFTGNAYFSTRAYLIDLLENELSKEIEKLKQHDFSAPKVMEESGDLKKPVIPKQESPDLKEVDLHIQELLDDNQNLEPKDILEIQMDRFRFEMESAIQNGTKRIVFIHGVGQGTLKNELRRELSNRYKKYDFQDASFRDYGYGATMVILRRK
ncbi:hypothetical protein BA6E_125372 [Bacteroidales bacterium 6E]|nr:hypothetical protein BA6E_125372 [Bacteroidales bacterium 6E]